MLRILPKLENLMPRLRLALVVGAVAIFALFTAQSAQAAPTHYAIPVVTLDVEPDSLDDEGSVDGHAESDQDCDTWEIYNDFNGQTASGSGFTENFTFTFPEVDTETQVTITAECTSSGDEQSESLGGGARGSLSTGLVTAPTTGTASETITLEPEDDDGDDDDDDDGDDGDDDKDDNGALPDTGAPDSLIVGTGILLAVTGAAVIFLVRRRREAAI
jgi:LPXTG-motif cell wall-anchored protein